MEFYPYNPVGPPGYYCDQTVYYEQPVYYSSLPAGYPAHHHPTLNPAAQDFAPGLPDQTTYYSDNLNYIVNDAFIIVDPEFPFIDLPYLQLPGAGPYKKAGKGRKGGQCDPVEEEEEEYTGPALTPPEISYDRAELLQLSKSPLCQAAPDTWPGIARKLPRLVRREGPTANIIIKEVRAIRRQEEQSSAARSIRKETPSPTSSPARETEDTLTSLAAKLSIADQEEEGPIAKLISDENNNCAPSLMG